MTVMDTEPIVTEIAATDWITPIPTKAQLVARIAHESGCSVERAGEFVSWAKRKIKEARRASYAKLYLTDEEMMYHDILVAIAPDGAVSRPGTAHAMLERFVLDPKLGELGLLHDNDGNGEPRYCNVTVRWSVITQD